MVRRARSAGSSLPFEERGRFQHLKGAAGIIDTVSESSVALGEGSLPVQREREMLADALSLRRVEDQNGDQHIR
jgi:hypothetical protein